MTEPARPKIAVVAGGNSGEYEVSLKSAANIMIHIDRERFDPYLIVMIGNDWFCEIRGEQVVVNRSDFSLTINGRALRFDLVFNIMHGTPGEDGILQGYFDLIGIPVTSSGRLTSALTFNKYFCSRFVSALRCVNLTDVVVVKKGSDIVADDILAITALPCFVKPNQGGSSLGMSKVKTAEELIPALEKAFEQDDTVLAEAFIGGTEVTCGVFRKNGQIVVLPLTEIVPKTEYFDYAAKYLGESEEITPARISIEEETEIKRVSALLFQYLECRGFVRFDYILSPRGLYFLEVNTVPGMSNESIIPQMLEYHGMSMQDFLSAVIEEAL
jgi:D-alanine-D-alanine ligase